MELLKVCHKGASRCTRHGPWREGNLQGRGEESKQEAEAPLRRLRIRRWGQLYCCLFLGEIFSILILLPPTRFTDIPHFKNLEYRIALEGAAWWKEKGAGSTSCLLYPLGKWLSPLNLDFFIWKTGLWWGSSEQTVSLAHSKGSACGS